MDKSIKLIIESLLFASSEPLTPRQIHAILPKTGFEDIKNILQDLKNEYDEMQRSFIIKEVANGYQFRTLPFYKPYITNMLNSSPPKLSRPTLETLTIIAYKQPIIRQEIERYRGVDVGGILKTLLKRGLIKTVGRKALPGRPIIYGTTRKFLEVFDLKDLSSLPTLKEINELGDGEEE